MVFRVLVKIILLINSGMVEEPESARRNPPNFAKGTDKLSLSTRIHPKDDSSLGVGRWLWSFKSLRIRPLSHRRHHSGRSCYIYKYLEKYQKMADKFVETVPIPFHGLFITIIMISFVQIISAVIIDWSTTVPLNAYSNIRTDSSVKTFNQVLWFSPNTPVSSTTQNLQPQNIKC